MALLPSLTINDTGSITLPSGDFTNRTANTSTVTSFTSVGTTSWTCPAGVTSIEVLVVAGGGGGGYDVGGGGGAGGLVYNSNYPVTPGQTYTVTVGAGGAGAANNATQNNGGNSVFASLTAIGGGGGGNWNSGGATRNGANGGSGGGGAGWAAISTGGAGTVGQGYRGGDNPYGANYWSGGSGGGAGGPGINSIYDTNILLSALPGPGVTLSISGSPVTYSRGGWGGNDNVYNEFRSTQPTNSGNGGDGAGAGTGGDGAAGIVVIRYSKNTTYSNYNSAGQVRYNTVSKNFEELGFNNKWNTPATVNNAGIVKTGLVLDLDVAKYPGTGTAWPDLSQYNNHMTLTGSPTYSNVFGGDLTFNGSGQYSLNTNFSSISGNAAYTIAAWVKFGNLGIGAGVDASIIWIGGEAANAVASLDQKSNQMCSLHYADDQVFTGFTPSANIWYYAALTYNNNNKQAILYINGQYVQAINHNSNINITATKIGIACDGNGGRNWTGSIGSVQVYNRVLQPWEILQNYNSQSPRYVKNVVTVKPPIVPGAMLHLDAGDPSSYPGYGTTWHDLEGRANATLVNGPTYSTDGGGSIYFNASLTQKCTFPNVTLPATPVMTVSYWFKTSNATAYQNIFDTVDSYGIWMATNSGVLNSSWQTGNGTVQYSYSVNTWYNVTMVGGPQTNHVYINGTLIGFTTGSAAGVLSALQGGLNLNGARIGNVDGDRASEYLTGNVAQLIIYPKQLTHEEVRQNFEALRGRFGV